MDLTVYILYIYIYIYIYYIYIYIYIYILYYKFFFFFFFFFFLGITCTNESFTVKPVTLNKESRDPLRSEGQRMMSVWGCSSWRCGLSDCAGSVCSVCADARHGAPHTSCVRPEKKGERQRASEREQVRARQQAAFRALRRAFFSFPTLHFTQIECSASEEDNL